MTKVNEMLAALSEDVIVQGSDADTDDWADIVKDVAENFGSAVKYFNLPQ